MSEWTSSMRDLACAAAVLATLFLAAASGRAAEGKTAPDWFRYGSSVEKAWNVSSNPDDPMLVTVERKQKQQRGPVYRVMVLYPRPSSAYDIAITKILEQFESRQIDADFTIVNFDMDESRGRNALHLAEHDEFNLIFAMGSESTAWLYERYRGGALPVVSVCSKDPVQLGQMADYQAGSKNNFAFTSLNVPVEVQMAYVKELKPNLKNLAVLVDGKNVSAVQTQAEPIAAYARQRGIQVLWGVVQDPSKAQEELAQIVRGAVQTMRKNNPDLSDSIFWVTGSTSVFLQIGTINEHADRVPVVSVVPEIVREGTDTAALAIGISFESNAILAAIYGADILTGRATAGDLKVGVVTPPDIAISFLKAREIGLRIPFSFFEAASFIYDYDGRPARTTYGNAAE